MDFFTQRARMNSEVNTHKRKHDSLLVNTAPRSRPIYTAKRVKSNEPKNANASETSLMVRKREIVAPVRSLEFCKLGPPNEFGVRMVGNFRLLNIQVEAIRWMVERELRVVTNPYFSTDFIGYLLAMFMGLGKSVCDTTLIMRTLQQQRALRSCSLILTEKTLLGSFATEIRKFYGDQLRVVIMHRDFLGSSYDGFGRSEIQDCDIILTTYCTLESRFKSADTNEHARQFRDFHWFRTSLDESHAIRNRTTQTFRVVNMLKSSIRMCMTGTPIHNGVKDLFSQLEFCGLNMPKGIKKTPQVLKDFRILDMIKFVESSHAHIALPPKTVTTVFFELSETEKFLHQHFYTHAKLAFQRAKQDENEDKKKSMGETRSGLTRLLQVCTAPFLITKASKLESNANEDMVPQEEHDSFPDNPALDAWIRVRESAAGLMSSKMQTFVRLVSQTQHQKTIVFANLTSSLRLAIDSLVLACPAFKSRIVFVHGKIRNVSVREKLFHQFRTDPNCTHLFLTLKVGGCGLNLVEASTVIFLEQWYNNAAHLQGESRVHRIGQVNPVNVYYLIAKGSIEEKVQAMARDKLSISNECNALSVEHNKKLGTTDMELLLA
jgi:SNF2 family DNA or RNA helicase